ncbi:ATP-binding protein [Streptococcus suis]|uniref:ATP-binding protein n=1 Tax=Streptococcus suis TaxID=1307 RepID=A0A9Q5BRQ8_STRSU|nr:ATP-binding protein [Streptococcus suis]MCK3847829.1 ATP-binding protein [Streptococcus suis]MCK3958148.1 ATP-binding protein [Streptococcus suis]MCK4064386.1 ATP-binding protein [Streptococcus suis]NQJ60073.1 ATP-binding protein [Streptococcus suis]NQJ63852.1 ATP-binding protein [Streptococcus suis]
MRYPIFHDRKTGQPIWMSLTGHVLLSGSTGSGKSVAMLHGVHCLACLSPPGDTLQILDYKMSRDWKELRGINGYWSFESAKEGFNRAYQLFRKQLEGREPIGDNIHWLIIDEFASLSEAYTDKKERAEFLRRFGEMVRLSRNIGDGKGGWRIWVSVQQANSELFGSTQARSQFFLRILVGGVSSEGKRMLFEKDDSDPTEVTSSPPGKGFAQTYGEKILKIIFPYENRRKLVFTRIKTMLERSTL